MSILKNANGWTKLIQELKVFLFSDACVMLAAHYTHQISNIFYSQTIEV